MGFGECQLMVRNGRGLADRPPRPEALGQALGLQTEIGEEIGRVRAQISISESEEAWINMLTADGGAILSMVVLVSLALRPATFFIAFSRPPMTGWVSSGSSTGHQTIGRNRHDAASPGITGFG